MPSSGAFTLWTILEFPSGAGSAPFPCKDRLWHGEPIFVRLDAAQLAVDELLYGGNVECVLLIGEADRGAGGAGPASAPDPVYVIFRIMRQRKIDDMIHALDVNAASGHIRCDQNPDLSGLEFLKTANPFFLGNITGEHGAVDPVAGQHLREPSHFVAPVAENQDSFQVLPVDDVEQQCKFFAVSHDVDDLLHSIDRDLFRFDLDGYRVTGPLGGEAGDLPGQCCAEE